MMSANHYWDLLYTIVNNAEKSIDYLRNFKIFVIFSYMHFCMIIIIVCIAQKYYSTLVFTKTNQIFLEEQSNCRKPNVLFLFLNDK